MNQLVRTCKKVDGWMIASVTLWDGVRQVLQSLINDKFVEVKTKFQITAKGREYLADPVKWQLKTLSNEDDERGVFWSSIYDVFDRALARLLARPPGKQSS